MQPVFPDMIITKQLYQTKNSTIWLIQHQTNKKDFSVLKGIKKEGLGFNQVEMVKRERKFYEENISLNYPRFIKAYQDSTNVYMEITLMEGLNMSHLLKEHLLHFNKKEDDTDILIYIIAQLTQMLIDLHSKSYCYRDLKMNNIIINESLQCFLIDFGFVKQLDLFSNNKTSTICGTLHMKAPEIFLTQMNMKSSYAYGLEVDIYALGVLIYELFTGRPPFPYSLSDILTETQYIDNVSKGITDETHFPNDLYEGENLKFKEDIIDLIKGCMRVSPNERYTLVNIKSHSLFSKKGFEYCVTMQNDIDTSEGQAKEIVDCIKFDGEYKKDYLQLNDDEDIRGHAMGDIFDMF